MQVIRTKRAYEPPKAEDGARFLVDGLWPRGLRKEELIVRGWLKEVAPSDALRQWYDHEKGKWDEFKERYHRELSEKEEELDVLLDAARDGTVTLVYASADTKRNNAIALQEYLVRKLEEGDAADEAVGDDGASGDEEEP